jgi:molybdate transport repressor ModE-like protein
MLSWDDFRHVKAIADSGSLNGAAHALGINHSTAFRRLGQIEQRLGARLFKRERSGYTLTPAGEQMVRLAERMERDVAAFAISKDGKPARTKGTSSGVLPPEAVMAQSGLEFLKAMIAGRVPQPPMAETLGFRLIEAAQGRAVFKGVPEFRHYNPIGSVHGGFAATLLDSALGCAIFSTLAKGETWTTLELKLNFVRALSGDTGPVRAEGRVIHRGRTVATSEGDVKDRAGKLYAHATTTCMIFPAKG